MRGDAKALAQVFQHLFVNSIEAATARKTRAQVRVRLAAQKTNGEVAGFRLAIIDNGLGIPPDDLPKVFSPFFSTKAQGLGLGLPIAQRVVLDHGGRLSLDPGGTGLCVNIFLPLEPPPAIAETPTLPGSPSMPERLSASPAPADQSSLKYEPRYRIGY